MIIFVPIKEEMTRTTLGQHLFKRGLTMIDISRGIKHVSLPDDFAQNS